MSNLSFLTRDAQFYLLCGDGEFHEKGFITSCKCPPKGVVRQGGLRYNCVYAMKGAKNGK